MNKKKGKTSESSVDRGTSGASMKSLSVLEHELREKEKEQNCLYNIAKLDENSLSVEEILNRSMEFIKDGFQYPEITEISIEYNDLKFSSKAFSDDLKSISATCKINSEFRLKIQAGLRKRGLDNQENPSFMEGEQRLMEILTDMLCLKLQQKQIHHDLYLSNERYEFVTQATSDAIWDYEPAENKLFWGKGFKKLFGYDRHANDKDDGFERWLSKIHPKDIDRIENSLQKLLNGSGSEWNEEYRFRKASGNYADVHDKAIVIRDKHGNAERVIGAMEDITLRKKEEQHIRLMESVVINANDAVLITRAEPLDAPDGPEIIFVNEAFEKMTGYTAGEVIGKTPRILHGPNTDFEALKEFGEKIRRWEPAEVETINYKKNGEEFWIHFSVSPVANEKGWYTHWISVERDVTQRKNRELKQELLSDIAKIFNEPESLRKSLYKTLSSIIKVAGIDLAEIWLTDFNKEQIELAAAYSADPEIETFHREAKQYRRFRKGEGLPGVVWKKKETQFWRNLHNKKTFIRSREAEQAGLKTGYGYPIIYSDECTGVLILGEKRDVRKERFFMELFDEVSEHLGGEIARKRLEEELGRIFKYAPDIICVAGIDGYFRKVNQAMSNLLGYDEEEILQKPILDFVHPDDREKTAKEFEDLSKGEGHLTFNNRYITKSGGVVWISWTTKPFYEEGITYSVGKDVTEQKELEQLLKQSNRLAKIGSWEVDLIENEIYWSDITREILGVGADVKPSMEKGLDFYKEGESRDKMSNAIQQAIEKGTPWDIEVQVVFDYDKEKWVRSIGNAELTDGKCVRLYGSLQDIHEKKELEQLLEKANRLAKIGSWEVDLINDELYWSDITREIHETGPDFEPDLETAINFYKDGESRERISGAINRAIESGTSFDLEVQIVTAKGNERWVRAIGEVEMADGKCVRLYGSFQDIDEKKRVEIRLKNIANNIPGVIFQYWLTPEGKDSVRYLSEGSEEIWGVSAADAMEDFDRVWAGAHKEDVEGIRNSIIKSAESLNEWHYVWRYHHSDGSMRWQEGNGTPQKLDDGTVVWDSIVLDVTEKKKIELLLEQATRIAKIGSWEVDLIKNEVYWSHITREIHEEDDGFHPDLKLAINYYKEGHDRDLIRKRVDRCMSTGEPWDEELRIITAKGNERWIRTIGDADFLNGKCVRLFGSFQDIDLRKRAEIESLKASREKNEILESISDNFYALDSELCFTYVNNAAQNILQVKEAELLKKELYDIYPVLKGTIFEEKLEEAGKTGKPVKFEFYFEPSNTWYDESIYPKDDGFSVFFRDISDKKQAVIALEEAYEERNSILESIGDCFFAVNRDWTVTYWNNVAEKILDMPRERIVGKNLWDVYEDAMELEFYTQYHKAMNEGVKVQFEEFYPGMDLWFEVSAYPSESGLSVFFKDITFRKQATERLLELNRSLEQQARKLAVSNAELEQFAFVASHDLQEPLRMITSFLAQLERKYDEILDEQGKQYIHFATDGAKRMRQIILDLLDYSRVGRIETEKSEVDVNEVIEAVLSLQRKLIEEKGAVINSQELPVIKASRAAIQQLFLNLINNALNYQEKGNKPVIRIYSEETPTHWKFFVKDNGIGINPEYADKIFNIFQRLHVKEEYSGTGVGLAICKKIVEEHGGSIGVKSEEGKGSTFYFSIAKKQGQIENNV